MIRWRQTDVSVQDESTFSATLRCGCLNYVAHFGECSILGYCMRYGVGARGGRSGRPACTCSPIAFYPGPSHGARRDGFGWLRFVLFWTGAAVLIADAVLCVSGSLRE
eukprot:3022364-Prymnesium_polylepis.2